MKRINSTMRSNSSSIVTQNNENKRRRGNRKSVLRLVRKMVNLGKPKDVGKVDNIAVITRDFFFPLPRLQAVFDGFN